MGGDSRGECLQVRPQRGGQAGRHARFLGREIDLGLEPGQRRQEPGPPAFVEPAQLAIQLAQGLTQLGAGLGGDQIGQALGRGQVQPAVAERAPGKLARLRRPQTGQAGQAVRQDGQHATAAMDLELQHILAGQAGRGRKPEQQRLVDRGAGARLAQAPQHGLARRRRGCPGQLPTGRGGSRAGQPHDRDASAAGAGGNGEDGLGGRSARHGFSRRTRSAGWSAASAGPAVPPPAAAPAWSAAP